MEQTKNANKNILLTLPLKLDQLGAHKTKTYKIKIKITRKFAKKLQCNLSETAMDDWISLQNTNASMISLKTIRTGRNPPRNTKAGHISPRNTKSQLDFAGKHQNWLSPHRRFCRQRETHQQQDVKFNKKNIGKRKRKRKVKKKRKKKK